jgi:hypothetical protein
MRRRTALVGALLMMIAPQAALAAGAEPSQESAAAWIQRMNQALRPGRTMQAELRMDTRDPSGGGVELRLHEARATDASGVRFSVRVESPPAGKGTVLTVVDRPGQPLVRRVYIPVLRRVRELIGVRRTDSFMGTEFSYEDMETVAPVERAGGSAERISVGGREIVRVTSPPFGPYERIVSDIDPVTALPLQVQFYDRAGQLYKVERFGDVKTIQGHPTPTRIEMTDAETGGRTTIALEHVRFDEPVPDAIFEIGEPTS